MTAQLSQTTWASKPARHHARMAPYAEAFLERRRRGQTHAVWDFLFTYYSFSPGKLMTWVPGVIDDTKRAAKPRSELDDGDKMEAWPSPALTDRVRREAAWIARLCENVLGRPARFACHGLHEWAMVYRQSAEQIRHSGYELRLSPEAMATFIESQTLCCSHYDAFRFFTPEARPLNTFQPDKESRLDLEQGGCLHTNMDLYKWAYKLWPWIGSDLVADAFEVAAAGRQMDMRASPYDLAALGFAPIGIETEEGRAEYRREQLHIATMAEPVRERLRMVAMHIANVQNMN